MNLISEHEFSVYYNTSNISEKCSFPSHTKKVLPIYQMLIIVFSMHLNMITLVNWF